MAGGGRSGGPPPHDAPDPPAGIGAGRRSPRVGQAARAEYAGGGVGYHLATCLATDVTTSARSVRLRPPVEADRPLFGSQATQSRSRQGFDHAAPDRASPADLPVNEGPPPADEQIRHGPRLQRPPA